MNYLENTTRINKRINNKFVEYKNNGDIIIYPDKEGIILKNFGRNNGKTNLQLKILSALIPFEPECIAVPPPYTLEATIEKIAFSIASSERPPLE